MTVLPLSFVRLFSVIVTFGTISLCEVSKIRSRYDVVKQRSCRLYY